MLVKASLIDPQNETYGWDIGFTDPCGWHHVTCNSELSVTKLELGNLQLSGTLSPSIGNLSNLGTLSLEQNNISGLIPAEIGQLSNLNTLDLSNNQLNGQIPPSLGHLRNLQTLLLRNNHLSGSFPSSLASIDGLKIVDISFNNLSGQVPRLSASLFSCDGNSYLCGNRTGRDCSGQPQSLPNGTKDVESSSRRLKRELIAVIIVIFTIVFMVPIVTWMWLWWRRKYKRQINHVNEQQDPDPEVSLGQLTKFTLRELQVATDNFSSRRLLGKGGFGNVYKGFLTNGTVVAVKRLRDHHAIGQFKTEVEMISLAVHRNLLHLIGYCVTSPERLLVYPYMPNGSVASRLRDKPALDWRSRKRIAVGAARGLLYLHEQCDPKIIHRDVKAANILLDEELEAVVGDFGLAKILDHRESHVTTAVRGTVGHIAPEYLSTGQSSEKTDVFGFGILLLELITGQRAIDFGRLSNPKGMVLQDWVKKLQQEKRLEDLVDEEVRGVGYEVEELEAMVQVAVLCTQFRPADRPKMSEVVRMLEGNGLAERWEAWQRAELDRCRLVEEQQQQGHQQGPHYFDLVHDSSLALELQLSGPR